MSYSRLIPFFLSLLFFRAVLVDAAHLEGWSRTLAPIPPPRFLLLLAELFLKKPDGTVTTQGGVNDKIGSGATINSTFVLLYGKVTFTLSAPVVPGVVTAAILMAEYIDDEIDVELLGGSPSHWQSNIFAENPQDTQPLFGIFGEIEDYSGSGTIAQNHSYTIDWNADRIVWSVDGQVIRTLGKDQTSRNGVLHYPSQPARVQLGIWDASSDVGTAHWAGGPIDWTTAPAKMAATFTSVTVECT
ncbi:glycoside hydrolase family 16 protein [Sparassis crispa]|uniref:Glycoside hydrolase family 16 protein n=1 Tax=Sparassis crispa TaxID=139825 RepID=A0A401GVB9_9APHY|nr:glycoside hydrolase family 16 protein [Sparassis crispa]GBE86146.1 glycoside hydrolase family 16 protein [Sparassis crispa]